MRWISLEKEPSEVSILTHTLFFKNNYKQQIVKELEANPTDLLFVQELTPAWKSELAPLTHKRYKYQKTYVSRFTYGIGIYSTYPIASTSYLKNSQNQPYCQVSEVIIKD